MLVWRRAGQVGEDVVGDDEGAGEQEPDDAVEDVGHKEGGGHENEQQDEVRPRVLPELVQVAPLLQLQHERHKACAQPYGAGDQPLVGFKGDRSV